MALGTISGQLLTSTLERDGVDLTITNNNDSILHFDMQNNRVGIKETNPTTELDVNGTLSSTAITTNTITASIGDLTLSPATGTDKIVLNGNVDISGSLTASLTFTLENASNIDFTQASTSGTVLTSDGDSTYSFQQPVITTQIAQLIDVDFTTNTPTTTSGLVLTSDGDSSYSFQQPLTVLSGVTKEQAIAYSVALS